MALNIPYAATIVGDYLWMCLLVWATFYIAANEKLNFVTGALCGLLIILINTAREYIYWLTLGSYFSKYKTEVQLKDHPEYLGDIAFLSVGFMLTTGGSAYLGLMNCSYTNFLLTAFAVSRDYWAMALLKDFTSMKYLHPWMHKKENYYLHKHHHIGARQCSQLHGFIIGAVDLVIENSVGVVLAMAFNQLVLGDASLHVLSFGFLIWTDGNTHSENPWGQVIGNPILDYFLKANIMHSLHHAKQKDPLYMMVYPWRHFNREKRDFDIQVYNKIMHTNLHYDLFKAVQPALSVSKAK